MVDKAGTAISSLSTESRFRRMLKGLSSDRARVLQMRLFALALFALGAMLTFNDWVFDFAKKFTEHPEILPVTLLVPFVYRSCPVGC